MMPPVELRGSGCTRMFPVSSPVLFLVQPTYSRTTCQSSRFLVDRFKILGWDLFAQAGGGSVTDPYCDPRCVDAPCQAVATASVSCPRGDAISTIKYPRRPFSVFRVLSSLLRFFSSVSPLFPSCPTVVSLRRSPHHSELTSYHSTASAGPTHDDDIRLFYGYIPSLPATVVFTVFFFLSTSEWFDIRDKAAW